MGVEGRDLVHFGQRQPHLVRQGRQVGGGQAAMLVLDQMQMLDQQIALARALAEQGLHLAQRRRIELPALRMRHGLAAPGAGMKACLAVGRRRGGPSGRLILTC